MLKLNLHMRIISKRVNMSKSFVKKDVLDLEHLEFDLLQIFVFTCSIFVLILFMKAREQFV